MGRQWSSGTSRPGWNREGSGQFRPQRLKRKPTVSRPARSRYATSGRVSGLGIPPEKCSRPPNTRCLSIVGAPLLNRRRTAGSLAWPGLLLAPRRGLAAGTANRFLLRPGDELFDAAALPWPGLHRAVRAAAVSTLAQPARASSLAATFSVARPQRTVGGPEEQADRAGIASAITCQGPSPAVLADMFGIYASAPSGRSSASAACSSLTGLSVPFWEVREPFREVRPIAPAGR